MADDEAVLNTEPKNIKTLFKLFRHLEAENFRLQREIKWIKSAPYYFISNYSIVLLATSLVEENARVGRSEPLPKTTYIVIKHGSRLSHLRVLPL